MDSSLEKIDCMVPGRAQALRLVVSAGHRQLRNEPPIERSNQR